MKFRAACPEMQFSCPEIEIICPDMQIGCPSMVIGWHEIDMSWYGIQKKAHDMEISCSKKRYHLFKIGIKCVAKGSSYHETVIILQSCNVITKHAAARGDFAILLFCSGEATCVCVWRMVTGCQLV